MQNRFQVSLCRHLHAPGVHPCCFVGQNVAHCSDVRQNMADRQRFKAHRRSGERSDLSVHHSVRGNPATGEDPAAKMRRKTPKGPTFGGSCGKSGLPMGCLFLIYSERILRVFHQTVVEMFRISGEGCSC